MDHPLNAPPVNQSVPLIAPPVEQNADPNVIYLGQIAIINLNDPLVDQIDPVIPAPVRQTDAPNVPASQQPSVPLNENLDGQSLPAQLTARVAALNDLNLIRTRLYRVSDHKKEKLKGELIPMIIGLGPFNVDLESNFKDLKIQYFKEFLSRKPYSIQQYWELVQGHENKIREFYYPHPTIPIERLTETMLIDSAFLVELFTKYQESWRGNLFSHGFFGKMPEHILKTVRRDLLIFENQLPFIVVEQIWGMHHPDKSIAKFRKMCMKFFEIEVPINLDLGKDYTVDHLLGLYHHVWVPQVVIGFTSNARHHRIPTNKKLKTVPSASSLTEYGVNFTKGRRDYRFGVAFLKGNLELPFLQLDHMHRCILANLVIYEEVLACLKPISSLCFLLNSLMRTDQDVNLLSKKGIIENVSGNDKDVVEFFTEICAGVEIDPEKDYLTDVLTAVDKHYQSQLKRWWGKIKQEYFRWPWSFMIFAYALVTVAMTITRFVLMLKEPKPKPKPKQ